MVTPEQARRYDVERINVAERMAVSVSGDIGHIDIFLDARGLKCDAEDAESAIVSWPDIELWTVIQLRDYAPPVLH